MYFLYYSYKILYFLNYIRRRTHTHTHTHDRRLEDIKRQENSISAIKFYSHREGKRDSAIMKAASLQITSTVLSQKLYLLSVPANGVTNLVWNKSSQIEEYTVQ